MYGICVASRDNVMVVLNRVWYQGKVAAECLRQEDVSIAASVLLQKNEESESLFGSILREHKVVHWAKTFF